MTTVELNETGDVAIFSISWESICEKYASRFREQSRGKRKVGVFFYLFKLPLSTYCLRDSWDRDRLFFYADSLRLPSRRYTNRRRRQGKMAAACNARCNDFLFG